MSTQWPFISILTLLIFIGLITLSLSSQNQSNIIIEWTLIESDSVHLSIPIILDSYNCLFITCVTYVSLCALIFSEVYIIEDKLMKRFTFIIFLFILSMIFFIIIPNIVFIIIGWDGLGITSFALIIYYINNNSLGGAIVTILTNRFGDILFLMAISLTLTQGHFSILSSWNESNFLVLALIMFTAITKSAQVPFCVWLPEAISAPTPVSILVHSSTLVTAGVYLLIRFHPFLNNSETICSYLTIIGALTIFIAGIWGITDPDTNNIVALSTLSQLGFIITSVGMGCPHFAFIHLITHAIFNSLLFLCVGVVIISNSHIQALGSLNIIKWINTINVPLILSLYSLNAFPFLAGYYSNELIFEDILFNNIFFSFLIILGTLSTATYSTRIWRGLTYTQENTHHNLNMLAYTLNLNQLWTPILLLTLGSISIGVISFYLILPNSQSFILSTYAHWIPLISSLGGLFFAIGSYYWFFINTLSHNLNPYITNSNLSTLFNSNTNLNNTLALSLCNNNISPMYTLGYNINIYTLNTLSHSLNLLEMQHSNAGTNRISGINPITNIVNSIGLKYSYNLLYMLDSTIFSILSSSYYHNYLLSLATNLTSNSSINIINMWGVVISVTIFILCLVI